MNTSIFLPLLAALFLLTHGSARAEGRAGQLVFSDGHKLAGALSLTPGRKLRLFTPTAAVDLTLDEVQTIQFRPEKEQMREGFYFPNAGQATQAKTGEVYPVRYLATEITLANGSKLQGHLFTTMLFVETDDATQKVLLEAKQTGADGQKMADLIYPTAISFDAAATTGGFVRIDLTKASFTPLHSPVVAVEPDLAQPPTQAEGHTAAWTLPTRDPGKVLFAVEASDGIHVAWPATEADAGIQEAVKNGLAAMHDFFDTRDLLGCVADGDEIYSLVMLKRKAATDGAPGKVPWSLVFLHWKFDAEQKKVTLLNRVLIKLGGVESNPQPPPVLKEAGLLGDIVTQP